METITAQELHERLQENEDRPVVVHTLAREKFEKFNIPGAINLPADSVERLAPKVLKQDQTVVTFCWDESCDASEKVAEKLESLGFENVLEFAGGFPEWEEAGFPVEEKQVTAAN